MGRALHLILLGSISLMSLKTYDTSTKLNEARDQAVSHYAENQSRNICNSMAQMLMSTVADNPNYRSVTPQSKGLFNGDANYTVTPVLLAGMTDSVLQINVQGVFYGDTSQVTAFVRTRGGGFVPAPVKAAISTNNPVKTLGNLTVDGRDHDLSGNLISDNGTLGIWTTSTVDQSGNSKIGSTSPGGADIAPIKSASGNSDIVQYGQTWPGGYPDSPDKVLGGPSNGYSEGTLKAIAQSGAKGSQYATNPSSLTFPLRGVTYVELPSGNDWISANIQGEGILIVHNSASNAIIKNLNNGTFTGLIIADDIIHVHTNIIGAVVGLSPSPSEGNCIGNGSGDILFSREAIENATGQTLSGGGGIGASGYAVQRLEVVHWYE